MTLKDPLDDSITPYDLLGVRADASREAVQTAFAEFMRNPRNRSRIGDAQDARRQLSSPYDRAAIDIWFYEIEHPEPTVEGQEDQVNAAISNFARPCRIPHEALFTDLNALDRIVLEPVEFENLDFADLMRYDGLATVKWEPELDR